MDVTLIVIDSDAELTRARALVDRLWHSEDPAHIARLQAQARLIAAYEESKWPRRPPSTAELIRHLMDQHGLTREEMVPLLGTPSRVSEVLRGKKELSTAMVQCLRARFRVPADLLVPPPKEARRASRRAASRAVRPTSRGRTSVACHRPGRSIIAPRRSNSAHLHRPWRARFGLRSPSSASSQEIADRRASPLARLLTAPGSTGQLLANTASRCPRP